MKFLVYGLGLIMGLGSLSTCSKSRGLGPAKAVPVREDGAVDLQLMSFNLRYESPDDRDLHAWRQRVVGVVKMIRRLQPDCIGVQEALHGQVADLWASLPDYEFYGVGREDGQRAGEYSGIFYRRERFRADPADCGTFWLSGTPAIPGSRTWGNEFTRVAAWVRLVDLATGRGFYVFNSHWDHQNQQSRERAALLIAQRIDQRAHPAEPLALIGDFNSSEANPGVVYLTGKPVSLVGSPQVWANGLQDTYHALHPGGNKRRTLHFWSGSLEGMLKVDYILVSRGAKIEVAEIISEDQPVLSDHFPVTARVKFPRSP